MAKDYLTVNKTLETVVYKKNKFPGQTVRAPDEILIKEKKYTLLVSLSGRYGDTNSCVLHLSIINNRDKLIESVDRYEFNGSPLNYERIKKMIKKALLKL